MTKKAAAITQEVCAVIGIGLFAFGLWQIYPPAALLFGGAVFISPFVASVSLKRGAE